MSRLSALSTGQSWSREQLGRKQTLAAAEIGEAQAGGMGHVVTDDRVDDALLCETPPISYECSPIALRRWAR
jgi:hypothetical protein